MAANVVLSVIYDECFRKTVNWPGMLCSIELLAILLRENTVKEAVLDGEVTWWLKSHIYTTRKPL